MKLDNFRRMLCLSLIVSLETCLFVKLRVLSNMLYVNNWLRCLGRSFAVAEGTNCGWNCKPGSDLPTAEAQVSIHNEN